MLSAFTRNYEDNSTEAGFQFTFYCDLCQDGFKTTFIESSTDKKGSILRGISGAARAVGNLFGHKEHDKAFELSQIEARQHYNRCHNCRLWVCDADFNENEGLCVACAPRVNVKVVKARSDIIMDEIDEQAEAGKFFNGKIESKTVICPVCNKPSGEGKFCNSCGANLTKNPCPKCGTQVALGVKFCGECGSKVI